MKSDVKQSVINWLQTGELDKSAENVYYFDNRNALQDKLITLTQEFLSDDKLPKEIIYLLFAVLGEIGNNSFDHNLGNWPDVRGVVFGYDVRGDVLTFVLVDKGRGILKTLQKVKPELQDDKEALEVAFTEIISGRAPEARGNGLKFVRQSVKNKKMRLTFLSGTATAIINEETHFEKNDSLVNGCLAILEVNTRQYEKN